MLVMRTSERSSLKRCTQQWYWAQVEGLEANRLANPLWFGTAVHEALAQWYLPGLERGPHPAETFDNVLVGDRKMLVTNEEEELEYENARAMGIDMMKRYVEHYGRDEHMFFLATEQKSAVLLPQRERALFGTVLPKRAKAIRYVFTFDGVFRNLETGEVWLAEHKTAASIRVDHLPLDDQAGSYWTFAGSSLRNNGQLKDNEQIAGIEYNFMRKAPDDQRPQNEFGKYMNKPTKKEHYIRALSDVSGADVVLEKMTLNQLALLADEHDITVHGDVSATQPPPYLERFPVYRSVAERATQRERIQDEAFFAEAYRNGDLPITKSPDKQHCNWCQFKSICEMDEQGEKQSVEEMKQLSFHVRDPYEVYRKSAE